MYTYLDRPVVILGNHERFLLWAMRSWRHCRTKGLCPPRTLYTAFSTMRSAAAIGPFHQWMRLLDAAGAAGVGALPDRSIGEAEAILLALVRAEASGEARVSAILARLLPADDARLAGAHLTELVTGFAQAGAGLGIPGSPALKERRR